MNKAVFIDRDGTISKDVLIVVAPRILNCSRMQGRL